MMHNNILFFRIGNQGSENLSDFPMAAEVRASTSGCLLTYKAMAYDPNGGSSTAEARD